MSGPGREEPDTAQVEEHKLQRMRIAAVVAVLAKVQGVLAGAGPAGLQDGRLPGWKRADRLERLGLDVFDPPQKRKLP